MSRIAAVFCLLSMVLTAQAQEIAKSMVLRGQAAETIFFKLEQAGAMATTHTPRITTYMDKNIECTAETNLDSKETEFTCTISLK